MSISNPDVFESVTKLQYQLSRLEKNLAAHIAEASPMELARLMVDLDAATEAIGEYNDDLEKEYDFGIEASDN